MPMVIVPKRQPGSSNRSRHALAVVVACDREDGNM